ncbi:MAG: zinc ribbon domain-containing protein [Nanoarchaeota archaeon]
MPYYKYECCKCGQFDIFQSMKEKALDKCPTCSGLVERIITPTNFIVPGALSDKNDKFLGRKKITAKNFSKPILYSYICDNCSEKFEILHVPGEEIYCSKCNKEARRNYSSDFSIRKGNRPIYSYKEILGYETVKQENQPRRKVNKKSDGGHGVSRVY